MSETIACKVDANAGYAMEIVRLFINETAPHIDESLIDLAEEIEPPAEDLEEEVKDYLCRLCRHTLFNSTHLTRHEMEDKKRGIYFCLVSSIY